jgi:hypothetical protein
MNYKKMLMCVVIGSSMQNAWGMESDAQTTLRALVNAGLVTIGWSKPDDKGLVQLEAQGLKNRVDGLEARMKKVEGEVNEHDTTMNSWFKDVEERLGWLKDQVGVLLWLENRRTGR